MELLIILLLVILALVCWQYQKLRYMLDQEITAHNKNKRLLDEYSEYSEYVVTMVDNGFQPKSFIEFQKTYMK